jgi:hypothetical protein
MAYIARNFSVGTPAATSGVAPTIHTYATIDATATVDTSGYFNDAYDFLQVGDLIYRVTYTTTAFTTVSTAGFHTVMTKTASTRVIDVSDTTTVTVTNTD